MAVSKSLTPMDDFLKLIMVGRLVPLSRHKLLPEVSQDANSILKTSQGPRAQRDSFRFAAGAAPPLQLKLLPSPLQWLQLVPDRGDLRGIKSSTNNWGTNNH